jgi:hypothetical protein
MAEHTVSRAAEKTAKASDTDTRSDDQVNQLKEALSESARAMLTEFLRKTRQSRRKGGGSRGADSRKLDMVRDSSLRNWNVC